MIELYILRHGQTTWNAARRIQGSTDIELNEKGRQAARNTGKAWEDMGLHFDAVYSSPLKRAYETACLASAYTGLEVHRDKRLRELCFGVLEGEDVTHINDPGTDPLHGCFFEHPERYQRPEGGESLEELCARVQSFLEDLMKKYTHGERILVAGHGAMNKAIMRVLKKTPLKDFWSGGFLKNCSVNIVRISPGQCEIIEEGKVYG
ncbi:putative phosphoglycerate mutase [Catenibacillus scindens]|uniref:Putative phosphoglycerate mutase n=1 Tax=Catenibacillus scindens TaxID=673271 RepID=A0A7W8M6R6_9FIRM|nr:histidine phosphatase family protein [Catenibacillus scindens]MBB5265661.1 putative phosphoglycerate mutase [Catenibacillus scindens]